MLCADFSLQDGYHADLVRDHDLKADQVRVITVPKSEDFEQQLHTVPASGLSDLPFDFYHLNFTFYI